MNVTKHIYILIFCNGYVMCTLHFVMLYVLWRCTLCDVYVLKTFRFGTFTLCAPTFCNIKSYDIYIMLRSNIGSTTLRPMHPCIWPDGSFHGLDHKMDITFSFHTCSIVFNFLPACFYENHLLLLKIVPKAGSNFCSVFPSLSLVDFLQCTFMMGFWNNFYMWLWKQL